MDRQATPAGDYFTWGRKREEKPEEQYETVNSGQPYGHLSFVQLSGGQGKQGSRRGNEQNAKIAGNRRDDGEGKKTRDLDTRVHSVPDALAKSELFKVQRLFLSEEQFQISDSKFQILKVDPKSKFRIQS